MKACNRKILELFYNAKHTGRISKPDAIGRVGEDSDGLIIELTWRVIGGVISDAKFRAFANPNAIAITSLMVDNIIGKSVDDALLINEQVIIDNLGEFLPEYLEVYDVVRECIADAYDNYLKRKSRTVETEAQEFDYEAYIQSHQVEDGEQIDILQIQRELQSNGVVVVSKGRGRPRKLIDTNTVAETGEKRGRGRPRKVVEESEVVELGEKRGRGRPRKEVNPDEVVEVGEKRGRGRPRKIVDETEIVEIGEKRGRGRPRKVVDETEVQVETVKRGRGRPRKEVNPDEVIEVGEKRGRGRPRKPVDPNAIVEVGEKRGRGRPKKEVKFNLPSDLDDVIGDEDVELLINGNSQNISTDENMPTQNEVVEIEPVSNLITETEEFDDDYDLFKSNIRNILSGKEVSNQHYSNTVAMEVKNNVIANEATENDLSTAEKIEEEIDNKDDSVEDVVSGEKRGRGRPRKEVNPDEVVEVGEKRGRGRPRKIVVEEAEEEHEKRGRGRPRIQPVSSLTRSLSPRGMMPHSNQEIMFASKNVTTTNININVTKTTTSIEDDKTTSDEYSHNTTISKQQIEINTPYISNVSAQEDEIDVDENLEDNNQVADAEYNTNNNIEKELDINDDFEQVEEEDFDEEIDTSNIKDEAPSGGLEDLLKALLDD